MNWSERLYNDVLMFLPDAPQQLVERLIVTVAGDFFRDVQVLHDEVYIDLLCNQSDYLLPSKDGQRIVFVERVSVGDCGVTDANWCVVKPAQYRHGLGWWVDLNKPRQTIFISRPQAGKRLAVEYSWTPDGTQCFIPDHIIGRYASPLRDGVLAKLHMMKTDETMYDPNVARMYWAEYERERNNAINEKYQNFQPMPLVMQGRPFV